MRSSARLARPAASTTAPWNRRRSTKTTSCGEFLLATLKKAGLPADPKKVNAKQGDQHVKARNNQDWEVVDRKYLFRSKNGEQVECNSKVTPASPGSAPPSTTCRARAFCAHDIKSYKHAVGVCTSQTKVNGKTVFSGLRDGINSARGIRGQTLLEMPDDELKEMVQELLLPTRRVLRLQEVREISPPRARGMSDTSRTSSAI